MTDWQSAFANAQGNEDKAKQQIDQELSKFKKTVSKEINTGDSKIDERPQEDRTNPNRNFKQGYQKREYRVGKEGFEGYKPRGRGGNRGNFNGDRDNTEGGFKVRERGRGERGGFSRGDRGDRGRGFFRGERGTRGRGRGGWQDRQAEKEEGDQSADELTAEEYEFIVAMKKEHSQKLKGIVNQDQIGRKCIDLKFDEQAIKGWVNQLLIHDTKYTGVKDFGWNETATRAEKINKRQEAQIKRENWKKMQAEKAERQKRWEENQKRREENKKKREEKAAADAAKKAEKENQKTDKEEGEDKDQNEDGEYKVKDGKGTKVYRQKAKEETAQPEEKPQEEVKEEAAAAEEYNDEEYGDYEEEEDYGEEQPNEEAPEDVPYTKDVKDSEGGSEAALLNEAVAKPKEEEFASEPPKNEPEEVVIEEEAIVEVVKAPVAKEDPAPEPKKEETTPMNMGMPAMMPMSAMKQDFKPGDSISLQQSQQIMNDAQQHMMYCWQMLQHYQVVYNQQLVYQQQLMNTSGNQAPDQQQFMSNMNLNFGMNPMMMPGMGHGDQQNMMSPMPGMMPFYPQNGQNGNFFMGANQTQNKES